MTLYQCQQFFSKSAFFLSKFLRAFGEFRLKVYFLYIEIFPLLRRNRIYACKEILAMAEESTAAEEAPKQEQEASAANADSAADTAGDQQMAESATAAAEPAENPLWTACKTTPWEFDCWMALVPTLEKAGDASAIREGYEGLLKEFPLCYGYWEKYARLELKENGKPAQIGIFDRGVAAVPCVELWGLYCNAMVDGIPAEGDAAIAAAVDTARSVFERAVAAVGGYWGAGTIWDAYVKFEEERSEGGAASAKVAALVHRASNIACEFSERFHTKLEGLIDGASEEVLAALTALLAEEAQAAVTGTGCTVLAVAAPDALQLCRPRLRANATRGRPCCAILAASSRVRNGHFPAHVSCASCVTPERVNRGVWGSERSPWQCFFTCQPGAPARATLPFVALA